jgi:hypothetical protein
MSDSRLLPAEECNHRGFEAVTVRMQKEAAGHPEACPWCQLAQVRSRIEAIDPYPGAGGRDCGLGMADSHREVVQAFKDAVLDIIDETAKGRS